LGWSLRRAAARSSAAWVRSACCGSVWARELVLEVVLVMSLRSLVIAATSWGLVLAARSRRGWLSGERRVCQMGSGSFVRAGTDMGKCWRAGCGGSGAGCGDVVFFGYEEDA